MNAVRERIHKAVTVKSHKEPLKLDEPAWASIPEVEPDEFDIKMLREIEEDPDCQEFVTLDEAHRVKSEALTVA